MTTFKIPESADEAVAKLSSLGARVGALERLLSAREWERAAIVACLVGPERGKGRPPKSVSLDTFPYSTVTLSSIGIYGLLSHNTVAKYRNIWVKERPIPDFGDEVDLTGLPRWTGEVRSTVAGTASPASVAAREPEPREDEPVDTEAAAVRQARIDGTLRLVRDDPEEEQQEPYVTPKIQAGDLADTVMHRVVCANARDVERAFEEDYPTINEYRWRREQWQADLTELAGVVQRLIDRTAEFSTEPKEGKA